MSLSIMPSSPPPDAAPRADPPVPYGPALRHYTPGISTLCPLRFPLNRISFTYGDVVPRRLGRDRGTVPPPREILYRPTVIARPRSLSSSRNEPPFPLISRARDSSLRTSHRCTEQTRLPRGKGAPRCYARWTGAKQTRHLRGDD